MEPGRVTCSHCKAVLESERFNTGRLERCPSCQAGLRVEAFPALFRPLEDASVQASALDGESSCFFHPQKKAVAVCETCGRFLCALCELDFNGKRLCPSCLESGKKQGKIETLLESRTLYDKMALMVATLPWLIFIWGSIIGAPMAIYLVIRHWNAPCSLAGRSRWMYWAALLAALAGIAIWVFIITAIYFAPKIRR